MVSAGLNGIGRFGLHLLRAWLDRPDGPLRIVAINDAHYSLEAAVALLRGDAKVSFADCAVDAEAGQLVLRRAGHRISGTIILVVQGALVVGGVMTLVVVPLLIAQSRGTGNPTVLPLNYGVNFAVFWAAVAVVAAGVSFGLYARGRRPVR